MTETPCLSLEDLSVAYGDKKVARHIDFSLPEGGIGCLLGPSGCGKTSLLRTIAGFEPAATGRVLINGKVMSEPGFTVPPEQRQIGMVFQDFALFPHLSAADNIAFGLRKLSTSERTARVQEMLTMMGLAAHASSYPHELSGGQQQRLAVARAMAPHPAILLMDEPFSAIDPDLREHLASDIRETLKRHHMTAILVTHDQFEAFAMADKIAVLSEGRMLQQGTAYELYHQPANREVADFIGEGTMVSGTVRGDGKVATPLGTIEGADPTLPDAMLVDLLIRPDDLVLDPNSVLRPTVTAKAFRGNQFRYTLTTDEGVTVICTTPSHEDHAVGSRVGVSLAMDHVNLFPKD